MRLANTLFVLLLCAVCNSTLAGSLDLKKVSADAKWLVHVDLERVRETNLYDDLCSFPQSKEALARIARIETILSLKRTDVKSITLYGKQWDRTRKSADGVAVISGKFDTQRAMAALMAVAGSDARELYGKHTVFAVPTTKKGRSAWAAFHGGDLVVAREKVTLKQGIDVLAEGTIDASARQTFSELAGIKQAMVVATLNAENMPRIVRRLEKQQRQVRSASLVIDEAGRSDQPRLDARMVIATRSDEGADALQRMIDGSIALVELQLDEGPEFDELLEVMKGLSVEAKGKVVTLRLKSGVDDITKLIHEAAERGCFSRKARARRRARHKLVKEMIQLQNK